MKALVVASAPAGCSGSVRGCLFLFALAACSGAPPPSRDLALPLDLAVAPDLDTTCSNGRRDLDETDVDCGGSCPPCALGQMCRIDHDCGGRFLCSGGICGGPGAVTGAPCAADGDCAGSNPRCLLQTQDGTVWPGGYCTSGCKWTDNDPLTSLNAACPGAGTCAGGCLAACSDKKGPIPCTRAGYSCFDDAFGGYGCEPTALSQCNPTVCGGGGCAAGNTCLRVGADDVGYCTPRCDPFAQDCPMLMGSVQACIALADCGEGSCYMFTGGRDGAACTYDNDCDPGFACRAEGMSKFCRPYCGGPNDVACPGFRACVALFPNLPVATVGVCAP